MTLSTPCVLCTARIPARRAQWQRAQWHRLLLRRHVSTDGDGPPWFRTLREEMLQRKVSIRSDIMSQPAHEKLRNTLAPFLPAPGHPPIGVPCYNYASTGHHLIYCNAALRSDKLLADGTDALQSPGGNFIRRMWAGGSLALNPAVYLQHNVDMKKVTSMQCDERIKDVQLRGRGDNAKVFVTIERSFKPSTGNWDSHPTKDLPPVLRGLMLIEERTLVFLKERSRAEREAIQAGQLTAVKYLDRPGRPKFSHTLTPTQSLLFRYSALTFNAHSIHLDREYCRNVEGHRHLLVHGPLSLTLMLKLLDNHLGTRPGPAQTVRTVSYRNLAPLYCGEEMRLCGREKLDTRTDGTCVFDVWIEGPTGGMAVKATVVTSKVSVSEGEVHEPDEHDFWSNIKEESGKPDGAPQHASNEQRILERPGLLSNPLQARASNVSQRSQARGFSTARPTQAFQLSPFSLPDISTDPQLSRRARRAIRYRALLATHRLPRTHVPHISFHRETFTKIRHVRAPPSPMSLSLSPLSKILSELIHRRAHGLDPPSASPAPEPLVRPYAATPYDARRHTAEDPTAPVRVRRLVQQIPVVRPVGEALETQRQNHIAELWQQSVRQAERGDTPERKREQRRVGIAKGRGKGRAKGPDGFSELRLREDGKRVHGGKRISDGGSVGRGGGWWSKLVAAVEERKEGLLRKGKGKGKKRMKR
ncbi:hypothetical protein BDV95DRAFT_549390 [Massariosphaeria phaeospora]|uniref:HotDog domain-containing protein n=1 Tax=Massariosphaeria phaeospora TaxID=100035 RepID=A0A7C8M5M0_9PLEO|nr:hypothetical protein BDV95DRAFT_549390 [Massariosphaeria phaeospora]